MRVYELALTPILEGMDSLSLIVLVWLSGLFLLVLAVVYAKLFTHAPNWFMFGSLVTMAVLCTPIVLAAQGSDAWLVWSVLGLGFVLLAVSVWALIRASVRVGRDQRK